MAAARGARTLPDSKTPGGAGDEAAHTRRAWKKNDERRDFGRASPHVSLRARLQVSTRSSLRIVGEGYDSCNPIFRVWNIFPRS